MSNPLTVEDLPWTAFESRSSLPRFVRGANGTWLHFSGDSPVSYFAVCGTGYRVKAFLKTGNPLDGITLAVGGSYEDTQAWLDARMAEWMGEGDRP